MKGYHFYATMPDERKSKSASKAYPMEPFTRATLRAYAERDKYVECLAVDPEGFSDGTAGGRKFECAGALQADNDQAVCGSSCSREYLRDRCVRISEDLARKLHPALLRYLET